MKYTYHANIKCNCGHKQKDHSGGMGWCHESTHPRAGKCGCTWFYPNDRYIKRKNKQMVLREGGERPDLMIWGRRPSNKWQS